MTLREWNRLIRRQRSEKQEQAIKDQIEQDRIDEQARMEKQDRSLFKSSSKRGPFHGESLKVIIKVVLLNVTRRPYSSRYFLRWRIMFCAPEKNM
jgi:hypothetical protein